MKKLCLILMTVVMLLALSGVSLAADLRGSYDLGNGYSVLLGICVT